MDIETWEIINNHVNGRNLNIIDYDKANFEIFEKQFIPFFEKFKIKMKDTYSTSLDCGDKYMWIHMRLYDVNKHHIECIKPKYSDKTMCANVPRDENITEFEHRIELSLEFYGSSSILKNNGLNSYTITYKIHASNKILFISKQINKSYKNTKSSCTCVNICNCSHISVSDSNEVCDFMYSRNLDDILFIKSYISNLVSEYLSTKSVKSQFSQPDDILNEFAEITANTNYNYIETL